MKILQINTVYGEKSTGRTCQEVEKALIKSGNECVTAFGLGNARGDNVYRIDNRFEYYIHNILSQITGLEGYFSIFATIRLIHFINEFNPDVIHLRNLHGHYLNLPLLFSYLKKIDVPIIQNLHDCWAFTGKCAYYTTIGCNRWQAECGSCPVLRKYPKSLFFDRTKKMIRDKMKWYSGLNNLTVVGVSDWTKNEAEKSFLNKCAKSIIRIYNWINLDVFHPYNYIETEDIKKEYGIPSDKFLVVAVSAEWVPGSPRYEDIKRLSEMLGNDCMLIIVGRSTEKIKWNNTIYIPFVKDTSKLAKIYSISDVYVHCSIEDTFGKVIAEALACGTPAIVYGITGCAEIVDKNSGYIIRPRDVEEMFRCISDIKKNGKEMYSEGCILNVNKRFKYETNVGQLLSLYKSVIIK